MSWINKKDSLPPFNYWVYVYCRRFDEGGDNGIMIAKLDNRHEGNHLWLLQEGGGMTFDKIFYWSHQPQKQRPKMELFEQVRSDNWGENFRFY